MTLKVETRIDRLDEAMARLAENQAEAWRSQASANRSIDRLSVRVATRVQSRFEGRMQEYDLLVVYGDYLLINETKSTLGTGEVRDFLKVLREVRTFLPEYREKKIIGTMASLLIEPSVLSFGQKNGLVMLGLVGELMQVLNDADFSPTLF